MQRLLGDLHDCDVWVAHLPAFLDEERARVVAFYGSAKGMKRIAEGLHYLQENRRASREQLYQETLAYWRHLQSGNVWGRLRQELDHKPPAVATVVETPASAVPEGT